MQKWEYKYVELDGRTWVDSVTREKLGKWKDRIPMVDKLGEAGWELGTEVMSLATYTFIFKRPMP